LLPRDLPRPWAKRGAPGPWRRFVLTAGADGLRVGLDNEPELVVARSRIERDLGLAFFKGPRPPAGAFPEWPRGDLGVFVSRGGACFRNVVLEPLR
jgi:hypothetical protein